MMMMMMMMMKSKRVNDSMIPLGWSSTLCWRMIIMIVMMMMMIDIIPYIADHHNIMFVNGYPDGAGSCYGNEPAVDGSHLGIGGGATRPVYDLTFTEANITVMIVNQNTTKSQMLFSQNITTIRIDHTYEIQALAENILGVLIRFESDSTNDIMMGTITPGEWTKIAPVCFPPIYGVTHFNSQGKPIVSGIIQFNTTGGYNVNNTLVYIDITIVFANTPAISKFAYGRYTIRLNDTSKRPNPVVPVPMAPIPVPIPVMVPVKPPASIPVTAPIPVPVPMPVMVPVKSPASIPMMIQPTPSAPTKPVNPPMIPTVPVVVPTKPVPTPITNPTTPTTTNPSCFSSENRVEVRGIGPVLLSQLRIGDYIKSDDSHEYTQVYSFGHYHPDVEIEFLQIHYEHSSDTIMYSHHHHENDTQHDLEHVLEIASQHLLYVVRDTTTTITIVRADDIRIGDRLISENDGMVVVNNMTRIVRRGVYAPWTMSGSMMISGIVVSCYIDLFTSTTNTSYDHNREHQQHIMGHLYTMPHRIFCRYFMSICQKETYTDHGYNYVAYGMIRITEILNDSFGNDYGYWMIHVISIPILLITEMIHSTLWSIWVLIVMTMICFFIYYHKNLLRKNVS